MNPYLEAALKAVQSASAPAMSWFHGDFEIETKADATPVTIADREAELAIRRVLGDAFPDHGIYGEEFGQDGADAEFLWLIDPIDGTKSFVRGLGMWSIQVALMHRGEVIVGVSLAPASDELAWAARGEGAWFGGERIFVSGVTDLAQASLSTGNLVSLAAGPGWDVLGSLVRRAGRTRGYGDYYHYHRLAQGQLDAVIESDVNVLDIAALSLIVTEAGGVFTDLDGRDVGLDTTSVLAANPPLHAQLFDAFSAGGPA